MSRPHREDEYTVVVVNRGLARLWEWEIYRNGQPLPVRLRRENFRSQPAALAAGKLALHGFLEALAREQNN
jgi:hypothetical protein